MARHNAAHHLEPESVGFRRVQVTLPEGVAETIERICALTGERPADVTKRIINLGAAEDLKRLTRRAA
jgi:hypothetical protein